MIVDLDVPFVDARARDLHLVVDAPQLPVLASIEIADLVPGGHLSLRLLGASHQAIVNTPAGNYAETVACVGESADPIPPQLATVVGSARFDFHSQILQLTAEELKQRCEDMRQQANDNRGTTLIGRFPGHPDAMTFLSADASGAAASWSTAHCYPEDGRCVLTQTTVSRI